MKAPAKHLSLQACVLINQSAQQPQLDTLLAYLLEPSMPKWVSFDAFEMALKKCAFQNVLLITNDFDALQKKLHSKRLQNLLKAYKFFVLLIQKEQQPAAFSYTPHIRYVNSVNGNLPPQKLKREVQRELRFIKKMMLEVLIEASRNYRHALARLKAQNFLHQFEFLITFHYSNHRFTTAALAKMMQISTSTLERKAVEFTGKTPKQYLLEYRLQNAKNDLSNSYQKVGEVAKTHGFASSSYFSVRFFERFGLNPSQVRHKEIVLSVGQPTKNS